MPLLTVLFHETLHLSYDRKGEREVEVSARTTAFYRDLLDMGWWDPSANPYEIAFRKEVDKYGSD
jgi:hypothetical protein